MTVNINNRDYKLQNGGFAVVNSKLFTQQSAAEHANIFSFRYPMKQ